MKTRKLKTICKSYSSKKRTGILIGQKKEKHRHKAEIASRILILSFAKLKLQWNIFLSQIKAFPESQVNNSERFLYRLIFHIYVSPNFVPILVFLLTSKWDSYECVCHLP